MLSMYGQALVKRANLTALTQFRPPVLPQRIYSETVFPNLDHYKHYCEIVGWQQDEQVHPCYIQVLALKLQLRCLLDKKSPFAAMGLVHIENTIVVHNTINLTSSIDLRVRFSSVRQHRRGWLVTITVQALQNDQCVAEASSGYLAKVRAAHVAPQQKSGQTPPVEEFGEVVGELEADKAVGRRYAGVSGDINPIHLSTLTAKAFGFKKAIAHGMWSLASAVSNIVAEQRNHAGADKISEITSTFHKPMLLPALASIYAEKHGDKPRFRVSQGANCFITGTITFSD